MGAGLVSYLAGQAGLANPRLASHEYEATRTAPYRGQGRLQHAGLRIPPYHDGA
jgi:hypothetical protein